MSLQDFLSALDSLVEEASNAFDVASDEESLEVARVRYLGQKSGALRDIMKQMAFALSTPFDSSKGSAE